MARPPGSSGENPPERRSPKRWVGALLGAALLGIVIIGVRHFSEAKDFALLIERAEPWWLILAVGLQVVTYLAQGQVFRVVARAGHSPLGLGSACRLGLVKLFVDQAVPSGGLSGTMILANGFERRGLPHDLVAAGVVVDLGSYYAAYVVCLALALVILVSGGEASAPIIIVSLVFFAFAIALSATILALAGRGTHGSPRGLARLRPLRTVLDFVREANPALVRNGRILVDTSAYQIMIVLCDAATLLVLVRSVGADGAPRGVFASFMISSLFRTIGIIPGGLGTFEAASVVTLRIVGIPLAAALAATLLFRGLSFWLPLVPGLWLSRAELRRR